MSNRATLIFERHQHYLRTLTQGAWDSFSLHYNNAPESVQQDVDVLIKPNAADAIVDTTAAVA